MKKDNINLMDVGHVLGRNEMKKIMAGCGSYCLGGGSGGTTDPDCSECGNNKVVCNDGRSWCACNSEVSSAVQNCDGGGHSTYSSDCCWIYGECQGECF